MDSGSGAGCLNPKDLSAAWSASSDPKGMYITRGQSIRARGEGREEGNGGGVGVGVVGEGGGWAISVGRKYIICPANAPIHSSV